VLGDGLSIDLVAEGPEDLDLDEVLGAADRPLHPDEVVERGNLDGDASINSAGGRFDSFGPACV
jgi:hypothetical protein